MNKGMAAGSTAQSLLAHPCELCQVGRVAAYGPTHRAASQLVARFRSGVKFYPSQKIILRAGDKPSEILAVRSGWAFCYLNLSDGRRQIAAFLLPGDILAIERMWMPNSPLPYSVKSVTPLVACLFPVAAFKEMMHANPEQMQATEAVCHQYFTSILQTVCHLGHKSARSRIAAFLLDLQQRLKDRGLAENGVMDFPLRQDHVADALGLTTQHVNRCLASFRKEGVLTLENQKLAILDHEALVYAGEEI